jgi:hypothetical protein
MNQKIGYFLELLEQITKKKGYTTYDGRFSNIIFRWC